jgi:hypothetical protein
VVKIERASYLTVDDILGLMEQEQAASVGEYQGLMTTAA